MSLSQVDGKAFFVLSTGRCGTQTLSQILATADNANVWHHPEPDPIEEAILAWWNRIDQKETFWKVRGPIIRQAWSHGMIHGETDMLMTPFADAISEAIPQSKFIVLVRNPWSFVRSGMRRNYYRGHGWDHGRLRPSEDEDIYQRWLELDQFSQICWLWNETYRRIALKLAHVPANRIFTLRFEDLIQKEPAIRELFQFLDLEHYQKEKVQQVLSKKLNVQVEGDFDFPQNWGDDLHRKLWNQCSEQIQKLGYVL